MTTPTEHYLIRGVALHPKSLEQEISITRTYAGRGNWTTCTCQHCPTCRQLIQIQPDGALQTHGSGIGLRDICPGSHRPGDDSTALAESVPPRMPAAPDGFVACRVIGPHKLTTHLVQLDDAGSNGGRPTMCGLTRFGDHPDLPGWGLGDSGVSGPGINQVRCDDCYRLAQSAQDLAHQRSLAFGRSTGSMNTGVRATRVRATAIVQRMSALEEKATRDAVVQKLRELGYTVTEPVKASGWRCSRCGSDRWTGHRYGRASESFRRNAQCVPCGHVQRLPEGEPQ